MCEQEQQAVVTAEENLEVRSSAYLDAVLGGNPTTIAQAWSLLQQAFTQLSDANQAYLDCLGVGPPGGSGGAG